MTKAWKIAPGESAHAWDMCQERGCIVIGWRPLGDYQQFKSRKAVLRALKQRCKTWQSKGPRAAESVWRFANEVQPKHIVVANKGRGTAIGIGVIQSDYLPPDSPENPSDHDWLRSARLVEWVVAKPARLPKYFFVQDAVWPLEPRDCEQIKSAYVRAYPELTATVEELFGGVSSHDGAADSVTKNLLNAREDEFAEAGIFDPKGITDARARVLSSIVRRRGQPAFRKRLLAAYRGQCAVTGCDVEDILEAAHILPYKGEKTNHVGNGLLLRTDLHTLFDLHLLAVDERTMRVLVSPKLTGTEYAKYHGRTLKVPQRLGLRPSPQALRRHRRSAGLRPGHAI